MLNLGGKGRKASLREKSLDGDPVDPNSLRHMLTKAEAAKVESQERPKRAISVVGLPLSGKGTQAKYIAHAFDIVHIDVNDMVEKATSSKKRSSLSRRLKDRHIVELVSKRLKQADVQQRGFVLDNFPATKAQAEMLAASGVRLDVVLELDVSAPTVFQRAQKGATGLKERVAASTDHLVEVRDYFGPLCIGIDGETDSESVWIDISKQLQTESAPIGIIVSGAPGSGKGTQCVYIRENLGVVHLSSGDLLRAETKAQTKAGIIAKEYMDAGKLVPTSLIVDIIQKRLRMPDVLRKGFLLDGFPRTLEEAVALEDMGVDIDMFIFLDVPDEKIIERLQGRLIDPVTGMSYHKTYNPPPKDVASRCRVRPDDAPSKVPVRLETFHANVNKIKKHFRQKLHHVNGDTGKDMVWKNINGGLQKVLKKKELESYL